MKLLLIEDDQSLRDVISRSLRAEHSVVETASTYADARMKVFVYEYDCILLDIMLPDGNGLTLLQEMVGRGVRPRVIILSAKDSVDDKVAGLELGADDYLPKPFHLAELHARIRSVVRREHGADDALTVGNVRLLIKQRRVEVGDTQLDLSRKEYDMLHYLMNRQGHLISKETLAEGVWGDYIDQADNFDFIYAHMKNLRRKLKDAHATIEIKTIYGFGYKLLA